MPVVLWWQGPGPSATRPRAGGPCTSAAKSSPSRSRTCVGRPRSACVNARGSARGPDPIGANLPARQRPALLAEAAWERVGSVCRSARPRRGRRCSLRLRGRSISTWKHAGTAAALPAHGAMSLASHRACKRLERRPQVPCRAPSKPPPSWPNVVRRSCATRRRYRPLPSRDPAARVRPRWALSCWRWLRLCRLWLARALGHRPR